MSYEQRLEALGLYWLQWRRLRGDLIETYKILTDNEKINSDQLFQKATTAELRGHSLQESWAIAKQRPLRDAPIIWMPWKNSSPDYAHGYFSQNL